MSNFKIDSKLNKYDIVYNLLLVHIFYFFISFYKMCTFFFTDHSVLKNQSESEGNVSTILAQHLLGPLSIIGQYTIDNKHQGLIGNFEKCPCNEKDRIVGELGNTSYGNYIPDYFRTT